MWTPCCLLSKGWVQAQACSSSLAAQAWRLVGIFPWSSPGALFPRPLRADRVGQQGVARGLRQATSMVEHHSGMKDDAHLETSICPGLETLQKANCRSEF